MNVLFHCRPGLRELQGGDAIQINKTKEALEGLGVSVTITTETRPDVRGYDLIHIFNPSLVSSHGARTAREHHIPVVISTIFWPMGAYFRGYADIAQALSTHRPPGWLRHTIHTWIRYLGYTYLWNPYHERRLRQFFNLADLLLPNSESEGRILTDYLNVHRPFMPIPNGFEEQHAAAPNLPPELVELDSFILTVGRLEPRKNQHLLIEALMDSPETLVFIGNSTIDPAYTALCQHLAKKRGRTLFIDHLPHDQIVHIYRKAQLHVMPSWYETPGLSSLEAAAAGCSIVTTDVGGTNEYFGQEARYCRPGNLQSLRQAIDAANKLTNEERGELQKRLKKSFTWRVCGEKTLAAYQHLLQTGTT